MYSGWTNSMSVRAREALREYRAAPKSNWDMSFFEESCRIHLSDKDTRYYKRLFRFLNPSLLKKACDMIYASEWHHMGGRAAEIDFFKLDDVLNGLSDLFINGVLKSGIKTKSDFFEIRNLLQKLANENLEDFTFEEFKTLAKPKQTEKKDKISKFYEEIGTLIVYENATATLTEYEYVSSSRMDKHVYDLDERLFVKRKGEKISFFFSGCLTTRKEGKIDFETIKNKLTVAQYIAKYGKKGKEKLIDFFPQKMEKLIKNVPLGQLRDFLKNKKEQ